MIKSSGGWLLILTIGSISWRDVDGSALRKTASITSFNVSPSDRTVCQEGATVPPNRVDTTAQLAALRTEMQNVNVDAYLVVMTDEHGAYSGSGYDARVAYVSGFTGSNGWAVVTQSEAALWTDGRYFLQADNQMDCQWTLMKLDQPGYPQNSWDWLKDVLASGNKFGAYPNIVSRSTWETHETNLARYNLSMSPVLTELVGNIWQNRPPMPNNDLIVHSIDYAGKTYSDKLAEVRAKMSEQETEALVVNVLEQVAWLFNLRGSDRTDSLFYAFAIISEDESSLFIQNKMKLLTQGVMDHLKVRSDGTCLTPGVTCVNVYDYVDVYDKIELIQAGSNIWVDPTANQAIYNAAISVDTTPHMVMSPIELMKSIKNEVERRRFAECILRDSAAVVEFAAFLEKEINKNKQWNEITAAERINGIRSGYESNKGLSFSTISAFGPNAAVIHYRPETETVANIDDSNVYLLDSGGQYLDGTTDVTRTFHYGTPSNEVKEAYTRVLMGQIDLARAVWTEGLYGYELDILARGALYNHGWDYNHGTGHGIGYFLSVHEGPGRINKGYSALHERLYEGMFFSDEPGYYEDGSFGIRLENLVTVVQADTPNSFGSKTYLSFDTLTLVPYEPHLIKYDLMSAEQKSWLNAYNKRCLEEITEYLHTVRNNYDADEWLQARTQLIDDTISASQTVVANLSVICSLAAAIVLHVLL